MANVIKPPQEIPAFRPGNLFLAGSIEMGAASRWQDRICAALDDLDLTILNPRRDNWDSSWEQSISNPPFREQVEWELHGIKVCLHHAFYFEPGTRSPITLMELGLTAGMFSYPDVAVVYCPPGFWRKGNVDILCATQRHPFPVTETEEDFLVAIREMVRRGK